jgi:hypothetical protein
MQAGLYSIVDGEVLRTPLPSNSVNSIVRIHCRFIVLATMGARSRANMAADSGGYTMLVYVIFDHIVISCDAPF